MTTSRFPYGFALAFCMLVLAFTARAQPARIAGIVNSSAGVDSLWIDCDQWVRMDRGMPIQPGDKVLLVQMKGAVVDTGANPGQLIGTGGAGQFEFATVRSVQGTKISLRAHLATRFNTAAAVQIVRVAQFDDAIVVDTIRSRPWDGRCGGVVAISVVDTLQLQAPIDVSGQGFRGGRVSRQGVGDCNLTALLVDYASGAGGEKGEGAAIAIPRISAGRSQWATGGGGGIAHNSGGGGGGNGGSGGVGGNQWEGCGNPITNGGLGAYQNVVDRDSLRLHFGGGGGGGHQNNNVGTSGANGGGIIVVSAGTIIGNGKSLVSRGNHADTAAGDGGGGGGAGGSIMIATNALDLPLVIDMRGGNGANIVHPALHGSGGGGGGGILILVGRGLPALSPALGGGQRGGTLTQPAPQRWNGSNDGNSGTTILATVLPPEADSVADIDIAAPRDTIACIGDRVTLTATARGGHGSPEISWETLGGLPLARSATIDVDVAGDTVLVCRVTDIFGCTAVDTMMIDAFPGIDVKVDSLDLGSIATCGNDIDTVIAIRSVGKDPAQILSIASADPRVQVFAPALPVTIDATPLVVRIRVAGAAADTIRADINVVTIGCRPLFVGSVSARIVDPGLVIPDTIDLGWITQCTPLPLVRAVTITDTTTNYTVTIDSVWITAPFSTLLAAGDTIADVSTVDITWNPTGEGVMYGEFGLRIAPCGTEYRRVLRAEWRQSAVTSDSAITIDRVTDAGTVVIRNSGAVPVTVVPPVTVSDADITVNGTTPSLPAVIDPGDSIVVSIAVRPSSLLTSAVLTVMSTDPCDVIMNTRINRTLWAEATVQAPQLVSAPGETVVVPITIYNISSNVKGALDNWLAELRVRRAGLTYLGHDSTRPIDVQQSVAGDTLVLSMGGRWDGSDTLCTMRFLGLFEGTRSSPLDLSDTFPFRFTITETDVVQIDGSVDLTGRICTRNGRLVDIGAAVLSIAAYDVTGRSLGSSTMSVASESDIVRQVMRWQPVGPTAVTVSIPGGAVIGTMLVAP
ncbi:MAG: hypothetical protein FGM24_00210 [Candidatus Kapabacteria bacterium]|nr:hypothetical protein [Candidatus Kapabacteria bacterium]